MNAREQDRIAKGVANRSIPAQSRRYTRLARARWEAMHRLYHGDDKAFDHLCRIHDHVTTMAYEIGRLSEARASEPWEPRADSRAQWELEAAR